MTAKPLFVLCVVWMCLIPSAYAQEEVPDTLDWHGYFPLAVDNQWQYYAKTWGGAIVEEEWYESWLIVGDTLIDEMRFFKLETRCDSIFAVTDSTLFVRSCYPSTRDTALVRYDEELANLVERVAVTEDSSATRLWWRYDFHLDASFGSYQPADQGSVAAYSYERRGSFTVSGQSVDTTVKKIQVYSGVPGSFSFAHGVGLLSSYFDEFGGSSQELVYARVGDKEYGQAIRLETRKHPNAAGRVQIRLYPNPARARFNLSYDIADAGELDALLVDVLGREVARMELGFQSQGTHRTAISAETLSSGSYVLVLRRDGQHIGARAIVLMNR